MKTTLLTFLSFSLLSFTVQSQIGFTKTDISNTTGTGPYVIDSGQLSNDEIGGEYYNDIVIGTDGGNTVEYYKNLGGSFATDAGITLDYGVGAELTCINGVHIADLNEDNLNDIIATGYCNNRVVWFENKGDGTFEASVLISTISGLIGPGTVKSANLDNDTNGYIDLAIVVYDGVGDTDSVVFLIGDGTGGFTAEGFIVPETAGIGPTDVDLGDFDGDGDIDAVVSFGDSSEVKIYDNELASPGGIVSFSEYNNVVDDTNNYIFSVTFGDVNNDSQLDVIIADLFAASGNPNVAWYEATFPGAPDPDTEATFTEHFVTTTSTEAARALVVNLNNDVNPFNDIVISNGPSGGINDITWKRGNGMVPPNEFDEEEAVEVGGSTAAAYDITINDFNNDTYLDIASISYLTASVSWHLNDGNTLSIDEQFIEPISIYPNPVTTQLNFIGSFNSDLEVSVYDVLGKRIINKTIKLGESLDVSKLNNGLYIIKFVGYNNTYKFVKK